MDNRDYRERDFEREIYKRCDEEDRAQNGCSDYLIEIECAECGEVEYFSTDSLPGGNEHCPYCAECGALLPVPQEKGG